MTDTSVLPPQPIAQEVIDLFADDRPPGSVIGTSAASGMLRLGRDVERCIGIDHGALRFQPLVTPGWGRQGICYGPFRREEGLTFAVSINNGHNTSQGSAIPEHILRRLHRWAVGPGADSLPSRILALVAGPHRRRVWPRLRRWLRSTRKTYDLPDLNENLALGWFGNEAPRDPRSEGCGFVIHAAEGDNGELRVRSSGRCLRAFRRLQNVQTYYLVVLRERGAVYYGSAAASVNGLPCFPMMRPIAIDPFANDELLYAGIYQSVLGQIGFRVDTRVHGINIRRVPELACGAGTAHACDGLRSAKRTALPQEAGWAVHGGTIERTPKGAAACGTRAMATLCPAEPSGLIHCLVQADQPSGVAGIVWRFRDVRNHWLLEVSTAGCALIRVSNGVEEVLARDADHALRCGSQHSIHVLDADGVFSCHLDGNQLFNDWFSDPFLDDEHGLGILLDGRHARITDLEAHPRAVPMPDCIGFAPPWQRLGTKLELADDFEGPGGDLAGRPLALGGMEWEKTVGVGRFEASGAGYGQIVGSTDQPHPGRTFYTVPWGRPEFADLEVEILPPGSERGQGERCRAGLVFLQDADNYISFTVFLDDSYHGASIALFPKRHGFEELYDAVWTMVADKVTWGKHFRLRVAFDGNRFNVFINDELVLQRALTDLYPDDPPMRIRRVGLAANWEWGTDTGSRLEAFRARS